MNPIQVLKWIVGLIIGFLLVLTFMLLYLFQKILDRIGLLEARLIEATNGLTTIEGRLNILEETPVSTTTQSDQPPPYALVANSEVEQNTSSQSNYGVSRPNPTGPLYDDDVSSDSSDWI